MGTRSRPSRLSVVGALDAPPAASGYRFPAEWEPHAATWLSWPHNLESWPGHFEPIPGVFVAMVRALHAHELVRINVRECDVPDGQIGLEMGVADAETVVGRF